jgi:hypothetical protein
LVRTIQQLQIRWKNKKSIPCWILNQGNTIYEK